MGEKSDLNQSERGKVPDGGGTKTRSGCQPHCDHSGVLQDLMFKVSKRNLLT